MLSIAGEKTNEEAVRWVVDEFMRKTDETVVDYSVFASVDTEPGHYVFLMETDGMVPREKLGEYRDLMILKGTSPNQLKPVRVIDTPMKEKFFFGLVEDYGGEAPTQ